MRSNLLFFCGILPFSCFAQVNNATCLPAVDQRQNKLLPEDNSIYVNADRAQIQQDSLAEFSGKVEIISQSAQIEAETALIDKNAQQLNAEGDIVFHSDQMKATSQDITLDINSGFLTLNDTEYQMLGFTGRGAAETISLAEDKGVLLEGVSFSTCPENSEDWKIQASSLELTPGQTRGVVKNARFYLLDVPVLYLPYFSFPVTSLRESGLLYPKFSSSDRYGVSYEQPYYWNIAPNLDATFSPRYLSDRGVQLKTEFRYLTDKHAGQINLEYLPQDNREASSRNRYFYRFTHQSALADNWNMFVDYNGISDDNYIIDLGSDYYSRADTHLYQTIGVNYTSEQLLFNATVRDFAVIGNHPNSYRALPEMRLNYTAPTLAGLEFSLNSELAYFDTGKQGDPSATRLHFAPSITLPYRKSWGEFSAEVTGLQTFYQQKHVAGTQLKEDVSRSLFRGKLYGSLAFEKKSKWFNQDVTQTLEPKVQYLYTSYEDQSGIGLYDTTLLLNDFYGLFRGQEFTGLDRISDTNQLTLGVTTRILDKNEREQFQLSLGQIFYFDDNRVLEAAKEDDRSALAAELDWRISSKWLMHSEIQMSVSSGKVEKSNLSLDYKLADDKLLQINHRFVRRLSGEQIDQIGFTASWPLAKNWHWIGRWYRDMDRHRSIETYTGVQYESCCWAIRLIAQRHLSNRFDLLGQQSQNEFDSGIALQFELKGMGRKSSSRKMLDGGLFGYRQPYFLNN